MEKNNNNKNRDRCVLCMLRDSAKNEYKRTNDRKCEVYDDKRRATTISKEEQQY